VAAVWQWEWGAAIPAREVDMVNPAPAMEVAATKGCVWLVVGGGALMRRGVLAVVAAKERDGGHRHRGR
jgi:hypothetical protein